MADPMVIFEAHFANFLALEAVIFDRVQIILKHVTEDLDCLVLLDAEILVPPEPLIIQALSFLLRQLYTFSSVLAPYLFDHLA